MNDKKIKDYILGKSDEKTGREILEWIMASDENAERFFRIEELCDVMAFEKYHLDNKTEMALERLSNKIASRRRMNVKVLFDKYIGYIAAAVFTALVGLGLFVFLGGDREKYMEARTGSEVKTIYLPDGSKVWLNCNSSLKYPEKFKGSERIVRLTGEGYFEVAANKEYPFIVKSGGLSVRAVGTAFDFNSIKSADTEEVSLIEGSLVVSGNNDEGKVMINPGQMVVLDKVNSEMTVRNVNADIESVWHDNLIPLRNSTLPQLVMILKRLYDVEIIIEPGTDINTTYSGFIRKNESLETVLSSLKFTMHIDYRIVGNRVYVSRSED